MPVETAPGWLQPLPLGCLDSWTFHSLGEEKAQGSEGVLLPCVAPGHPRSGGAPLQGRPTWERLPDFPWSPGHLGSLEQTPGPHTQLPFALLCPQLSASQAT